MRSEGNFFALRLSPQQDLRKSIIDFAEKEGIDAGAIVTCVGSLTDLSLRLANEQTPFTKSGHFEIVSLVGTFSQTKPHLHISVSDNTGNTIGGHLLDGCLVYTTAELVLLQLTDLKFLRAYDSVSGYEELNIQPGR